jgi:uncharacterized protein (TIGR02145 family)
MKKVFRISGEILIIIMVFSAGCKKSDQGPLPLPEIISSMGVKIVTPTSAIGEIYSNLDSTISEWGVCWSAGHLPVITDNKVSRGPTDFDRWFTITGLSQQTDYYVRVYATNSNGTAYGEGRAFTTPADHTGETGTVEDADGNVYQTIGIGSQIWMTENLKTTRYRNGDLIGTTTPATLDISVEATPKYQWAYDGDESNVVTYGRLYTWYAANDTRNVCPTGWHIPTSAEWSILDTFLGSNLGVAGGKLKETGTTHWLSPNEGATNETGFTALPGGRRNEVGGFDGIGDFSSWWDGDMGIWGISHDYGHFGGIWIFNTSGNSVRCLQDN